MNILILDSWLKEHLQTKANPKQIGEYLSLCSQSVEKITKTKDDWLYEIEITTNRPDCLSVYGIARELAVILPRFGFPVKIKPLAVNQLMTIPSKNDLPLEVKISNPSLCPRFTAIVFDNVVIKPSPKIVQERLEKSGIRAINNIVDISNYLMLELGQPMHTFDYDKIKGAKITLRESAGGEKLPLLIIKSVLYLTGQSLLKTGRGELLTFAALWVGKIRKLTKNKKSFTFHSNL